MRSGATPTEPPVTVRLCEQNRCRRRRDRTCPIRQLVSVMMRGLPGELQPPGLTPRDWLDDASDLDLGGRYWPMLT